MAYKITDEKRYDKLTNKIQDLEDELLYINSTLENLKTERWRLVEEVYDGTHSHSTELIDTFIKDHNFNGEWSEKLYNERYFYYQEVTGTWDSYKTNLFVVYYRDVELRYKQLQENKNDNN